MIAETTRIYVYPVNARHSTVLGYTATSAFGKSLWDELDWRGVYQDGGTHLFNLAGGEYLHVRVKYDAEQDGRSLKHRRWYRVRCVHEIGTKWRGGIVQGVQVEQRARQWFWIVAVN